MEFKIPESLKVEHQELHAELARAVSAGGRVGDAARAAADILHPHFVAEEEFALPPLGLLPRLLEEGGSSEMRAVLKMTDRLKANLNRMLEEHRAILRELNNLAFAAMKGKKMEYVHLAEKLRLHAQTEEEVLYPAALLIGEYLKMKLGK